ncbi:MAG: sigma-54 dependent transcriptional regulator [Polyangiaceae bacterium]
MPKVLVVDDQEAVRTALCLLLELSGLEPVAASTPEDALALIREADIGAVIQDMNFSSSTTSGEEGIALFREIHLLDPELPVILMTAWTSLETAVQLVKEGAADYVAKPWDDQKLVVTVQNLLRLSAVRRENARFRGRIERERREMEASHGLAGLVYRSAAMHGVVSLAVKVARADVPVLITGPNGSGKEKLAEIVHQASGRSDQPLVKVNAGAIPDQLLEAELFGAEAGAYTGANKQRVGRFEAAHRGTLFLDEIGNLSRDGQAKLLRVLQTGEFERLGSSTTRKVDVRVVSATNADLPSAIASGDFREDLFFRLNVIELRVPPLSDRPEDVRPLTDHFIALHGKSLGTEAPHLDAEAYAALEQYEWPGNVRELENRIQRALLVCKEAHVTCADLDLPSDVHSSPTPSATRSTADPLTLAERQVVEAALLRANGVVSRAAAELGLSRQALYRRMGRLGIEIERRPKG